MRSFAGISSLALILLCLSGLSGAQSQASGNRRDGGASEVLQSIYIPPLLNAPFTAIVHAEWEKPIAGGGSITLVNQRRIARDSRGRIYEERWLLMPKDGRSPSRMNVIQIADPNAHTGYNCFTLRQPHQCILDSFSESAVTSYKPPLGPVGPLTNNMGVGAHQDLGSGSTEGIATVGSRDSTTYYAHVFGNDRDFTVTREFWQAPSLGVNLFSELSDPRISNQLFTVTDINLGEPDPQLFELPEGYTVVDHRKTDPASESRWSPANGNRKSYLAGQR